MNQKEFIKEVSVKTGYSLNVSKTMVVAMQLVIIQILKKGNILILPIGSFSVGKREARNGRNPRTGAIIKIPAKNFAKFKESTYLKGSVN